MTATRTMDWTDEGRRIGVTLDAFHAVVVVGMDPVATAEVALGIARVQAVHRRVALGDLLGEAEPLQSLVPSDDPHGLVDSFLYGVSLTKIAHRLPDAGELFIMPTGTSPVDYDELFAHPRWRRLIAGFREVGALLVIAAPADAAHVHELVDVTDGVVIVGDAVPADVSVAQSLAWIRPRRGAVSSVARAVAGESAERDVAEPVAPPAQPAPRRKVAAIGGVVVAVLLALAVFWFTSGQMTDPTAGKQAADSVRAQTMRRHAFIVDSLARVRRDSIARDSAARAATLPPRNDSFPSLVPANPGDSATAAAYSVLLEKTNGRAGAILDLRGRFNRLPTTTYGIEPTTRFFVLMTGAFQTRAGADSLLAQVHARRVLAAGYGGVAAYPLAFLVDSAVAAAQVAPRLARYAARGQPVYALRQVDGTARLYFGAYANTEEAALAVPQVREAGLTPTLVYRIGRMF